MLLIRFKVHEEKTTRDIVQCSRKVNGSGLSAQGSVLSAQDTGSRAVEESLHLCNGMHNTPYRITKFSPIDHACPCWVQRRKQLLFFLLVQPAGENTVADGVERADWHNL